MHNNNELTGQQTKFSKWLNDTFHEGKHATNAPIDFQGKHFGGGYHRELSKGHDILCFVDGIKMFKEGKFEAIRYENGVAKVVVTAFNQYGKAACPIFLDLSSPFPKISQEKSPLHHIFCDTEDFPLN